MIREGLRLDEQHKLVRETEKRIAEGMDEDAAYLGACSTIIGVTAKTFERWKPDIFKMMRGENTPAGVKPPPVAKGFPGSTAVQNLELARAENEKLKIELAQAAKKLSDLEALVKKLEDEKAALERALFEEDPKAGKKK